MNQHDPSMVSVSLSAAAATEAPEVVEGQQEHQIQTNVPKSHLIITNISKRANVRSLLQVGVAFGCTKILVVGQKSFQFTYTSNSNNSMNSGDGDGNGNDENNLSQFSTDIPKQLIPVFVSGVVTIERFDNWKDCMVYIDQNQILLIGVEIHENAQTIQEICDSLNDNTTFDPPKKDVAFLMGNEGTGLLPKHMNTCHRFCRIPQYGTYCGTASYNVYVAASIILYNFHIYQRHQQKQYYEQQQQQLKVEEVKSLHSITNGN